MLSRPAAALTLVQVFEYGRSLASLHGEFEAQLDPKDKPMWQQLTYGTLRFHPALELITLKLLRKKFKNKDYDLQMLLEIGLYQLLHTDIEPFAAINETVNAAKSLDKEWACGLLNACLRNFERDKDTMIRKLNGHPQFQSAMPDWLLAQIKSAWPNDWKEVVKGSNHEAPMFLRINARKTTRDDYLNALDEQGISAEASAYADHGIVLHHPVNVTHLPNFAQGFCSVQDEAAQLSGQILPMKNGDKVLDACAAPGGKSCHLLELADIELTALEMDEKRAQRIYQNLSRLELSAKVLCTDANATEQWWDGEPFDAILLDAPCSATGVIRRHPDIKYLRHEDDIAQLAQLQAQLLDNLWPTLKSGGFMLYATCSILSSENNQQINAFLARHADANVAPLPIEHGIVCDVGRQFLPTIDAHDGFYYCLLHKQ